MSRKPAFFKKVKEENEKKRDVLKEKLKGESYLYMGDPTLQWGVGGFSRGHMNLLYGPSKSGKSTQALMAAGAEQKKTGGVVVVLDSEWGYGDVDAVDLNGNPTERAAKTRKRLTDGGLDPDNTLIWQTNIASEMFQFVEDIEKDLAKDPNCVCSIIVDSWGGIQSEDARKKLGKGNADDAGKSFGGNAKTINPILQQLIRIANMYGVTVYSVQHVMVNMEQYGPKYLLPGGQKFIHLHDMILFIEGYDTKNRAILDGDILATSADDMGTKIGKQVAFRCEKSRNTVEGKTGVIYMNFRDMKFAKPEKSLFDLATRLGVIVHPENDKGGTNKLWWQYPATAATPLKWNGEKGSCTAIAADKDLFNRIFEECMNSSKMTTVDVSDVVDKETGKSVAAVIKEKKGA